MTWLQRYRVRHYYRNSMWILPVGAMLLAAILVRVLHWFEQAMGWQSDYNPDTMRTVLGTLAGALFTFIVFVCSSLLLVVQLASAQLTPRLIGVLFKDPVTKATLAMFVFAFTFTSSALARIGETVPELTLAIAVYSSAVCLGLFLFLIDRVSKLLRPSGALRSVSRQAHEVIENVYPRSIKESRVPAPEPVDPTAALPARTIVSPMDGVVLAFNVKGLTTLATRNNCVIEMLPQVGNFVSVGEPLFRVYGSADLSAEALYQSIALGEERTMEQDAAFAFRVMVDVASKALSPAVNDPTTAVLALDQIHSLLRSVGSRCLDDERVRDAKGVVRLLYRTPDWEDFVTLAVTEIRQFGGLSIQIARRLRAMLEDLIHTLPEERTSQLQKELLLLHRSAERLFLEPEDRALAGISDAQGVGGKQGRQSAIRQVKKAVSP